tara:strand:- start:943 stop:1146 length:204 start_codon:yes stop_codon:yes gene_type:complete
MSIHNINFVSVILSAFAVGGVAVLLVLGTISIWIFVIVTAIFSANTYNYLNARNRFFEKNKYNGIDN